jgi:hypothetical protein
MHLDYQTTVGWVAHMQNQHPWYSPITCAIKILHDNPPTTTNNPIYKWWVGHPDYLDYQGDLVHKTLD